MNHTKPELPTSQSGIASSIRKRWPAILLAVMTLAFFYPLLGGKALLLRDTFFDYYPWRQFAKGAFCENTIPFWNPYSSCGKPFVGNPQSAFFYPLHILFSVLPGPVALSVSTLLHVFLSAAFTYLFMRQFSVSKLAATLSGATFAFSGMMTSMIEFMAIMNCVIWIPLVFLFVERLIERRTPMRLCLLASVLSLQFLSGFPQTMFFGVAAAVAWWICRLIVMAKQNRRGPDFRAALYTLPLAALLALALVAIQFLPTYELMGESIRGLVKDPELDSASIHPSHLLTLLFPYLFGGAGYPDKFWAQTISEFWLGSYFLGALSVVLVGAAAATSWRTTGTGSRPSAVRSGSQNLAVRFFLVLAIVTVLLAMGKYTPLYMWLYDTIPLLDKFRWPTKILPVFVFAMSVLAGFGTDRVMSAATRGDTTSLEFLKRVGLGSIAILFVAAGITGWVAADPLALVSLSGGQSSALMKFSEANVAAKQDAVLQGMIVTLAVLVTGTCVIFATWRRKLNATGVGIALLALTFLNLFIEGRHLLIFTQPDVYEAGSDTVKQLKDEAGQYRTMSRIHFAQLFLYGSEDATLYKWTRDALVGDTPLPDRVFKEWGGDALRIDAYNRFHTAMTDTNAVTAASTQKLLDIASIRYEASSKEFSKVLFDSLYHDRPVQIAVRETAWPRARIMNSFRDLRTQDDVFRSLYNPEFDASKILLTGAPGVTVDGDASGDVYSIDYGLNSTSLTARSTGKSLLWLGDTWYPGWRVYVDGIRSRVYRANGTFRAVSLTGGEHSISFAYQSFALVTGTFLSVLALFVTAVICGISVIIRPKSLPGPVAEPRAIEPESMPELPPRSQSSSTTTAPLLQQIVTPAVGRTLVSMLAALGVGLFLWRAFRLFLKFPVVWPDESLFADPAISLLRDGHLRIDLFAGLLQGAETRAYLMPPSTTSISHCFSLSVDQAS
ncbi:MAG: YfhO family protein [Planctomycetota bacterium]|nr:YfhO family protein [Planctomycetota bacterium]